MYVFVFVCLPAWVAGCHVAHLLLSSCLTLGLSWISLGPRWQWSRQHRFGSCHMGRLQGNGAVSVSTSLVIAHTRTQTHRWSIYSPDECFFYVQSWLNTWDREDLKITDDKIISQAGGRINKHMHTNTLSFPTAGVFHLNDNSYNRSIIVCEEKKGKSYWWDPIK